MPQLTIRLFGPPQFFLDAKPLKIERRKTTALVAFLAVEDACSRESLSALLWPDCSQEQAAGYLRQSLWDFHRAAGEDWLERDGSVLRLLGASLSVDIRQFEALLKRYHALGRRPDPAEAAALLEAAEAIYNGDFLAGFSLRDCPEFDNWQVTHAEGLRLQLGEALGALTRQYAELGDYEKALAAARRWLGLDELDEAAHRALMQLYAANGQRSAALRQYDTCQRLLQEELGVAPETSTTQLFQEISTQRTGQATGASKTPSDRRLEAPPHAGSTAPIPVYLPPQPTTFLGRENELARIKEMLDNPECRLVTLVGPGGSGKTRLAVQAAGQSNIFPNGMRYPHGVYFTGLASASTPADIVYAAAAALKLEFRSGRSETLSLDSAKTQLLEYLAEKKVLLVLDNFEQLAGSGPPLVSELLSGAPGLKLIATSRVRLNLPEEWVLEVGGLPFPDEKSSASAAGYAAVQLFQKSAARSGAFQPTPGDWTDIGRICRMLDGMPLGIELAAAWTKMLSCQEIAAEISRNLDFLETQRQGAPERQRSLRAVFESSWQLLPENERAVFRRLSIFRGGFTREAAFQVAGASLSLLGIFVDKSLLRRVSSGRFDLHELIKQYAAEKLSTDWAGQAETEMRHAAYYAGWLRLKGEDLRGSEQLSALAALRAETHNLLRAWRWLVEHGEYDLVQLTMPDLILFYEMHGDYAAGREAMRLLIDRARRQQSSVEKPAELDGLLGLGLAGLRHFGRGTFTLEQSDPLLEESLELARKLPQTYPKAFILLLGSIGASSQTPVETVARSNEASQIFKSAGDLWGSGLALLVRGDVMNFTGQDAQETRASYTQSLDCFMQAGNQWGQALCRVGLSWIAWKAGDLPEAYSQTAQGLEIYLRMENTARIFETRQQLAEIAIAMGQSEEAVSLLQANLAILVNAGEQTIRRQVEAKIASLET